MQVVIGMFVTAAVSMKQALPGDTQPLPLRFELDAVLGCDWGKVSINQSCNVTVFLGSWPGRET